MIFNLYEIASIYNISERTLRRKLNDYNNQFPDEFIKTIRKGNKTALNINDIKRLIKYMGYDYEPVRQKSDIKRQMSDKSPTEKVRQKSDKPMTNVRQMSDTSMTDKDELIKFLKNQLEKKDTQIDSKTEIIKQQNSIIMATQKNMNDLLQQHNELKYTATKKEDLIKQLEYDRKKTESSVKAIVKLERTIEDALLTKRFKDGIEFSKQLLKKKKKR